MLKKLSDKKLRRSISKPTPIANTKALMEAILIFAKRNVISVCDCNNQIFKIASDNKLRCINCGRQK